MSLPKLERAAQNSAWFSALASAGVSVDVRPVERDELPRWIAERLARQSQKASPDTLAFLADACEGNLLAARQEIEKLALLLPAGELDHDAVVAAVADVARFDVQALSEAWLAGDATRALRILDVLRGEGESPVLPVWQLGEDVHALAIVQGLMANARMSAEHRRAPGARVGTARDGDGTRGARACRATCRARSRPRSRGSTRASKGMSRHRFDPWDELEAAALLVAGKPIRMPATVDFGPPEPGSGSRVSVRNLTPDPQIAARPLHERERGHAGRVGAQHARSHRRRRQSGALARRRSRRSSIHPRDRPARRRAVVASEPGNAAAPGTNTKPDLRTLARREPFRERPRRLDRAESGCVRTARRPRSRCAASARRSRPPRVAPCDRAAATGAIAATPSSTDLRIATVHRVAPRAATPRA